MAIYTVHVPDEVPDLVTRADRTVFLREGFSARAFLLGLLYLLWHRAWIASAVWVVLLLALAGLWLVLSPPLFLFVALVGLMHLYIGAEGPDLARTSLARRGYEMQDLVSAASLSDAEALYFAREHLVRSPPQPRPTPRMSLPVNGTPAVIGFPDVGAP